MKFRQISETSISYISHFHKYLVWGGFPQTAQIESVDQVQRIFRKDIIDKVLKQDMIALFGVRRILDLEQTFLYLCMYDGGPLDFVSLCANLQVKRPAAQHFIEILEAAHLIYRLPPLGYGKEILRGRFKIYLADAAIGSASCSKARASSMIRHHWVLQQRPLSSSIFLQGSMSRTSNFPIGEARRIRKSILLRKQEILLSPSR